MPIRTLFIVGMFALALTAIARRFAPGASRLVTEDSPTRFPEVSGFNLDREEMVFPRDFGAPYNVVFIAFKRWHQDVVDTWVPFVQQLETGRDDLVYYELPTINDMPAMGRLWVNEGMRAGIPDPTARERTVTLYIDTDAFTGNLSIPNKDDVHILLVGQQGDVVWRASGRFDNEKGESLTQALPEG